MDDSSIRALFERMREADAGSAPDIDSILSRQAERRGRTRRGWPRLRSLPLAAACLAAVALVVVLAGDRFLTKTFEPPVSLGEWRSPTDYLLEPLAESLLRGLPALGRVDEEVFSCDRCF